MRGRVGGWEEETKDGGGCKIIDKGGERRRMGGRDEGLGRGRDKGWKARDKGVNGCGFEYMWDAKDGGANLCGTLCVGGTRQGNKFY